jgi:PAS domain S-box-containing protein
MSLGIAPSLTTRICSIIEVPIQARDKHGSLQRRPPLIGSTVETPGDSPTPLERSNIMKVSPAFEDLDNYLNNHSVCMHTVDENGIITWVNETELKSLGYTKDEYVGRFIGDFHLDADVVQDILGRLLRFEAVNTYPARMRRKDGTTAHVMINSNVYKDKWGGFEHTRCFTTSVDEKVWKALQLKKDLGGYE